MTKPNHKGTKALMITLCLCVFAAGNDSSQAQSGSEAEALQAIKLATNPTTKLTAAEDFIVRFPKSESRLAIAELIAAEILKIKNGTVVLALFERAQAVFTSDQEKAVLGPVALEAYSRGNRPDDAFALAGEMLTKNPDDLYVLARMARAGAEEARKKNRKHADVALQYGLKAIALIEAGKRPASFDEITWADYKASLGQIYQYTAILYLAADNAAEAKARLTKAAALSPHDPANFAMLGRVINVDYMAQMKEYEAMAEGRAKDDTRKKLDAVVDEMIDAYARAAGLATGRPEYQTLLQQVIPDLTSYYKYRHKSTKGLVQLINQYKPKR